ncbi:hypothetical protein EMCRGX_G014830 [Ephydatia muelleri]|eukprot:Em0005g1171a
MPTELESLLEKKNGNDFVGKMIVVSDSISDGSFLVHHFISQATRDRHLLCLVSFAHAFAHYNTTGTKLGSNLLRHQQAGKVIFVDCLTKLFEGKGPIKDDQCISHQVAFSTASDRSLLTDLYRTICLCVKELMKNNPEQPVCLVMDDFSLLLSLGLQLQELVKFVHQCHFLLCTTVGYCKRSGYFILTVHNDQDCHDEDEMLLKTHTLHICDINLHVEGLSTGYSQDVHGELIVEWRNPEQSSSKAALSRKCMQFRLSEKSVHLFAKGMSDAVL